MRLTSRASRRSNLRRAAVVCERIETVLLALLLAAGCTTIKRCSYEGFGRDESQKPELVVKLGSEGYPPDLDTLVKGVQRVGALDRKLKFLRRIPIDPMTGSAEWGMRCYQDDPDSNSWCGENVYDVYSKSTAKALDGKTTYNTW